MDQEQRIRMLASGELKTTLFTLALPAMAAMLVGAVYNIVDAFFIGMLHDTAALGATAVVFPIFMMTGAVGLPFGMGAASVISRRLGEQRRDEASRVATTAVITTVLVGLGLSALALVLAEPLFRLIGATDTIIDSAGVYGRVIIAGAVFQMTAMCANNIIRAEGAAGRAAVVMVAGAVTNIILDPVFIFGLGLGIKGAAIATVISQVVSAVIALEFFLGHRGVLRINLRLFSPSRQRYHDILSIGMPTFVQNVLVAVAMSLLNGFAGRYGDAAVAAVGVQARLMSLAMMVLFGLGQGLQPLAGYAFGAGQRDRVKGSFNLTVLWGMSFGLTAAVLLVVFARPVVGLFSRDPEVLRIGVLALRMAAIGLPLVGYINGYRVLFQAIGRARPAMVLALARQGFIMIPIMLVCTKMFGLPGLLVSFPVTDLLTAGLTVGVGGRVVRGI